MALRVAPLSLALLLAAPSAEAQTVPSPEPEEPQPSEPQPSEPQPSEPQPSEPQPAEAQPSEPQPPEAPPSEELPFEPLPTEPSEESDDSEEESEKNEGTGFPRSRFVWRNLLAGRLNPLGLIDRFDIGWRVQLLDKPGKLYKDSQASVMLHTAVSPAFTHVGGRIEIQPLTVLRLGVTYAFMGSHGVFDFVQPLDDPSAEFDDKTLDDRADLNTTNLGFYLEPGALVQAAIGPVAIRSETKFYYRGIRGIPDDAYFWDPSLDILYPNNGWAMTNDADLLFLFDFGLTMGARYTVTHAFYEDDDVDLDGPAGDNVTTHRLGPAVLFKFFEDDPPTAFNAPIVGVLAQWWLAHRYRTGNPPADGLEDRSVSQALPYLLLFFSAKGDLYPPEPD